MKELYPDFKEMPSEAKELINKLQKAIHQTINIRFRRFKEFNAPTAISSNWKEANKIMDTGKKTSESHLPKGGKIWPNKGHLDICGAGLLDTTKKNEEVVNALISVYKSIAKSVGDENKCKIIYDVEDSHFHLVLDMDTAKKYYDELCGVKTESVDDQNINHDKYMKESKDAISESINEAVDIKSFWRDLNRFKHRFDSLVKAAKKIDKNKKRLNEIDARVSRFEKLWNDMSQEELQLRASLIEKYLPSIEQEVNQMNNFITQLKSSSINESVEDDETIELVKESSTESILIEGKILDTIKDIFKNKELHKKQDKEQDEKEERSVEPYEFSKLPADLVSLMNAIRGRIFQRAVQLSTVEEYKVLFSVEPVEHLIYKLRSPMEFSIIKLNKTQRLYEWIKIVDGFYTTEGDVGINLPDPPKEDQELYWKLWYEYVNDVCYDNSVIPEPTPDWFLDLDGYGTYCIGVFMNLSDEYLLQLWNLLDPNKQNKQKEDVPSTESVEEFDERKSRVDVDKYFLRDEPMANMIARDISSGTIGRFELNDIIADRRAHKFFSGHFSDKREKSQWDKKYLNKLVLGTDDNFNPEYLIHLIDVAKYVKGKEFKESGEQPEYNTDMTESQAKRTLHTLSQSLINDFSKEDNKKISQYTANIYANIINKNLLPKWAKGFQRVKITLDDYKSQNTFEFITPAMSQDFVSRFVNGRESLNGFIHRSSEIRIKMSPKIFHSMKEPDDAYFFFKSAIQYYDSKVERAGHRLMAEVMRLGHNMKHLIGNSKLSGLVTYPLSLLFIFNNVDMSSKNTFQITDEDIQTINKFVRNISSRYAAPEKEKRQIVEDVKEMVKELRESSTSDLSGIENEHVKMLTNLNEAIEKFLFNGYDDLILEASKNFLDEQIEWKYKPESPSTKIMYEKFGVKKLKPIPRDIVSYISIEAEAIKDANDKMMIASYCLGKLEIVEWYIELLEVGSKKYIVPHNKQYLENIRDQLLQCYKKIMDVKITNPSDRPIIDIKYPKGYEG